MRTCQMCKQPLYGNPNRIWWDNKCFCCRECVANYKKQIAEQDEKQRKQTIAEREQMRLLEWFN